MQRNPLLKQRKLLIKKGFFIEIDFWLELHKMKPIDTIIGIIIDRPGKSYCHAYDLLQFNH